MVAAGVEPAGVAGRVVRHVHARETGSFRGGRDLHDGLARHELGVVVDLRGRQFQRIRDAHELGSLGESIRDRATITPFPDSWNRGSGSSVTRGSGR